MRFTTLQKSLVAGLVAVVLAGSGYAIIQQQEAKSQALAEQKRLADQLEKATKSVETAEKSLKKGDLDTATKLVEALEDKDQQDKLTKRLEVAVQALAVKEHLAKTEELVKNAETNQTREHVASAQTEVDKVADKEKKAGFQARLAAVSQAIAVKEQLAKTEELVKNAETNQSREHVASAQTEVDKVADGEKKAGFQARLEAVNQAIVAREAQEAEAARVAAEQAQAQQAAEQAQVTQSYSQSSDSGDYYSNQGQNTAANNPSGYTYQPQEGGGQPAGYEIPQYGTAEDQAWREQTAQQMTDANQAASQTPATGQFPGLFPGGN